MADASQRQVIRKMSLVPFIGFKELPDRLLGVCTINWRNNNLNKEIHINPKHWDRLHKTAKLELIYHEMGHCAFKVFRHNPDPNSIMYESSVTEYASDEWIKHNWPTMVNQYWEDML